MKIQMSLSEDLVKRLDNYANANYLSRSAVVTIAVTQYLQVNEMATMMSDISRAMKKIADTGEIDEETQNQIEKLEIAIQMLSMGKS